ncbi:hypothetical protein HAX54_028902 [Datura stramonium]|uniref:Uncharacterized protein n=1 Tax=Datura stramonium TaxID=4076 RepID=A0ABS8V4Y4_DATST|nr:hypothetical protein [Datura stramonium]
MASQFLKSSRLSLSVGSTGKETWITEGERNPKFETLRPIDLDISIPRINEPPTSLDEAHKLEENVQRDWVNLFYRNHLVAKGMPLNYVTSLIKDGETIVELYKEEVEREILKWTYLFHVVRASPTIAAFERYIAA